MVLVFIVNSIQSNRKALVNVESDQVSTSPAILWQRFFILAIVTLILQHFPVKIVKDGLQNVLWLLITKRKARFLIGVLHFVIDSRNRMKRALVFTRVNASHLYWHWKRGWMWIWCEASARIKTRARFISLRLPITKCKTTIKKRALRFVISSHNRYCKPSFNIFTRKFQVPSRNKRVLCAYFRLNTVLYFGCMYFIIKNYSRSKIGFILGALNSRPLQK